MTEVFPIICGLCLGTVLALVRRGMRFAVGLAVSVVLGTVATLISGEFRIGWEFLLVDIPLVGVSSAVALALTGAVLRRLARRAAEPREPAA